MNLNVVAYLLYLALALPLTLWTARSLHRYGKVFLIDAYAIRRGGLRMADVMQLGASVSRFATRKPGSIEVSFTKLRISSPALITSTITKAASAVTSICDVPCRRVFRLPEEPCRA